MQHLSTLVMAAQDGDKDAFGMLVQRFQGMAYTSACGILGNAQFAEDVVQEAFVEAYLHLPSLREPSAFPGWFRRILLRQGDRFTRGKQLSTISLDSENSTDIIIDDLDPARIVERYEIQITVRRAIATLPEHERVIIHLFYGTGYVLKEIAEFLELPVSTVKKRLFDARKHLRGKLTYTIDAGRCTVREQHPPFEASFSTQLRLVIAARTGDTDDALVLLRRDPMLVNTKTTINHASLWHKNLARPYGYTALHEAAKYGHIAFASLLLDYGAHVNACTCTGLTPLHEATSFHQDTMVKLLLAHGAAADAASSCGLTPLHWAAMNGNTAIATCLLEYGAMPNVHGQAGRTPLHWAAIKGHTEVVQLLLSKGAEATIHDELGRTPLTWARRREQQEVQTLLLDFVSHERIGA